jgi:hypothetical protein
MDLARIAALQKRIKDWSLLAKELGGESPVEKEIIEKLHSLRNLIATAWEQKSFPSDVVNQIKNLEHKLEELHDDARLQVSRK